MQYVSGLWGPILLYCQACIKRTSPTAIGRGTMSLLGVDYTVATSWIGEDSCFLTCPSMWLYRNEHLHINTLLWLRWWRWWWLVSITKLLAGKTADPWECGIFDIIMAFYRANLIYYPFYVCSYSTSTLQNQVNCDPWVHERKNAVTQDYHWQSTTQFKT